MVLPDEYRQSKIARLRRRIEELEIVVAKLEKGTLKSYTINTGQTSQSFTKKDAWKISQLITNLEAQLSLLLGGGSCYVR